MVKIKRPLDFQGVTDHSEYAGTIRLANTPGSALSQMPIAEKLKVRKPEDAMTIFKWLAGSLGKNEPIKELMDPAVAGTVWKEMVAIADKHYKPGKFTTFASYEWTSMPNNQNMHRNVFFKDSKKVPLLPFTAIDCRRSSGQPRPSSCLSHWWLLLSPPHNQTSSALRHVSSAAGSPQAGFSSSAGRCAQGSA